MDLFRSHILICSGSNCASRASSQVKEALKQELDRLELNSEVRLVETGCFGLCAQGPILIIYPEGVHYCKVSPEDIPELVETHLLKGRVLERLLISQSAEIHPKTVGEIDFYSKQVRVVLRNAGLIDPENIDEALARDGYEALGKVLESYTPHEVVDIIKASGLQGRGGAGFLTGLKWEFVHNAPGQTKYVVCNADEGEPGTSKDRLILEGDPHTIIEGMLIAAYAVGADKGYVYIRGEYELSAKRLQIAIDQAQSYGLLGQDILGSGLNFDLEIRSGAGAYVCGEETALLESIEGKRGEPRYKPPYPSDSGLWGRPTLINNVETLANIAPILLRGPRWYRSLGTEKCPGTKVFTLSGDVVNGGLIEVPMGLTLREIIFGIGGGIPHGREFKMVQTGGTSGGCISAEHLDVPMDIPSLRAIGATLGSGALLVVDDRHCVVDLSRAFLRFFAHESCGKCAPCREGTHLLHTLVETIAEGRGTPADLITLRRIANTMQKASLCGLGQSAPVPLLTALHYFEDEYQAHLHGDCPQGVCI